MEGKRGKNSVEYLSTNFLSIFFYSQPEIATPRTIVSHEYYRFELSIFAINIDRIIQDKRKIEKWSINFPIRSRFLR